MVRAILQGRKTQTRRIVKWPDEAIFADEGCTLHERKPGGYWPYAEYDGNETPLKCPYGKPGDRLWVRETFRLPVAFDGQSPRSVGEKCVDSGYRKPWSPVRYEADGDDKFLEILHDFGGEWGKTRVSIHMPRWISRITLEVTGVRVERLMDISESDAIAEGCSNRGWDVTDWKYPSGFANCTIAQANFASLWQEINGPGSWAANPWVWVVAFKRVGG
jgi:hypothetical protein